MFRFQTPIKKMWQHSPLKACYHCNHPAGGQGGKMANLVVRNLDQRLVDALKQRAARHGRSAEAEHRAILEAALLLTPKKSFAEALSSMPDVGEDEDFERREDTPSKSCI
jgi:antitoxin FitA